MRHQIFFCHLKSLAQYNAAEVFDIIVKGLRDALMEVYAKNYKGKQLEKMIANETCKRLLSWQDTAGDTVIEYAVRGNAVAIIDRLIQLGLKLDRTNKEGGTLMHEAAKAGNIDMIRLLQHYGVSYTDLNAQGQTPVQIAVLDELQKLGNINFEADVVNESDKPPVKRDREILPKPEKIIRIIKPKIWKGPAQNPIEVKNSEKLQPKLGFFADVQETLVPSLAEIKSLSSDEAKTAKK